MSDFAGMEELLQDFLIEAGDLLSGVDNKLVDLERTPDDRSLLNDIFRGFHTIKGGAGFLNARAAVAGAQAALTGSFIDTAGDPTPMSRHVIWGNHRLDDAALGNLVAAGAYAASVTWGAPGLLGAAGSGENVVWGAECGGDDCDSIVWGTACETDECDTVVWGTVNPGDRAVWVWGTAQPAEDVVWGAPAIRRQRVVTVMDAAHQ